MIMDVTTRNLSARGSRNMPNEVFWFLRRAMSPSNMSVIAAMMNR
jgi:hypothetical protein